jgi:hypothetical protein
MMIKPLPFNAHQAPDGALVAELLDQHGNRAALVYATPTGLLVHLLSSNPTWTLRITHDETDCPQIRIDIWPDC